MTHHESATGSEQNKESADRAHKQRAFEEGRGHDVSKSILTTGQGGPEAGSEMGDKANRPHVMQQEEPSTREHSKAGGAMSGSRGTEGITRGDKGSQEQNKQNK